ncbi:MarR family winged helix-turn-helix transcriptional regulator [Phreatobacter sp. AB_2022a]|uniref:MarR family winged helix-turn-helix transcriptional regulator n=1 Tax=Phreatobacter sp. AB_2022a TaxID=3003134 RepID=UPI002286CF4B|nr:MarR family transcriptional regulator [Phreatobacter sp. AB_2022a]MCZ0735690.1 MarR family transcriptional regulator [Phreatobacter sp. AB_2022a]
MANEINRQGPAADVAARLMLALRRSSAVGVLHSQAVARRIGINASDLECLDLILMGGPATAGEIGRRTGLTSGAVTGLIDRLERHGLVERTADARDRRKVLVKVREERIGEFAVHFEPMQRAMNELFARYDADQLGLIAEFIERAIDLSMVRVTELNAGR